MDYQDFLRSFQDLNLEKKLTSPHNNSSFSENFPLVEDGINIPKESSKIWAVSSDQETTDSSFSWLSSTSNNGSVCSLQNNKEEYFSKDSKFSVTQNSIQSSLEWPSTSSANIWAYKNYNSNNGISSTKSSQKSLLDSADIYENYVPQTTSTNYEYGSSSTYNSMNQSNYDQILSNNMLNNSYIEAQEFADYNELPLDYKDWSNEDYTKCLNVLLNQSVAALCYGNLPNLGFDVIKMAKNPRSSRLLQNFLQLNNYYYRQRILNEILGSFYEVMIDEFGHAFFLKLVEFCNDEQMELILRTFHINVELFVLTAYKKYGSKSIQMLIKNLKKKPLANYFSEIVSVKLVELMTHRTGRYVVEQCFHVFNERQNEVLYRRIISCFKELATNESGCASLNIGINCITNPLRKELLEKIANQSGYLANDPWGNYVVQHVLELRDEEISSKIFSQLEKQYLTLAYKKGGSHVVEKCIESSNIGMISVVDVLLADEKSLVHLAKDPFGNYVIQKALKSTKEQGEERRHQALVRVLMRHASSLLHSKLGKHLENY
ncbi:pumilio homolog 15-like [Nicotiana sylvestris]|uniref:pumilio homolog 15-like n=1 Tax=Nicotiana sylvestris TaxID=4096 RepID=UPI00388C46A6